MTYVQAQIFAAERGIIARVTREGAAVYFYTGTEDEPGTWMQIGKAVLRGGLVDRRTVEIICGA